MDIRNTGNGYNGTDAGFFYLYLSESVKFIELADLYFFLLVRVVVV